MIHDSVVCHDINHKAKFLAPLQHLLACPHIKILTSKGGASNQPRYLKTSLIIYTFSTLLFNHIYHAMY
uniref:Uncharacterized protein n=1 Tax=Arundo donax TaxID=35708 RepID=A0A0A9G2X3_ARUDO